MSAWERHTTIHSFLFLNLNLNSCYFFFLFLNKVTIKYFRMVLNIFHLSKRVNEKKIFAKNVQCIIHDMTASMAVMVEYCILNFVYGSLDPIYVYHFDETSRIR